LALARKEVIEAAAAYVGSLQQVGDARGGIALLVEKLHGGRDESLARRVQHETPGLIVPSTRRALQPTTRAYQGRIRQQRPLLRSQDTIFSTLDSAPPPFNDRATKRLCADAKSRGSRRSDLRRNPCGRKSTVRNVWLWKSADSIIRAPGTHPNCR